MKQAITYKKIGWVNKLRFTTMYVMECYVITTRENEEIIAFVEDGNPSHYYNFSEFDETVNTIGLDSFDDTKDSITIRDSEQEYWNAVANWSY